MFSVKYWLVSVNHIVKPIFFSQILKPFLSLFKLPHPNFTNQMGLPSFLNLALNLSKLNVVFAISNLRCFRAIKEITCYKETAAKQKQLPMGNFFCLVIYSA